MNNIMTRLNTAVTIPVVGKKVPLWVIIGAAIVVLIIGAFVFLKVSHKI